MPFLERQAPLASLKFKASQIMSKTLITLPSIADMTSIKKALESTH